MDHFRRAVGYIKGTGRGHRSDDDDDDDGRNQRSHRIIDGFGDPADFDERELERRRHLRMRIGRRRESPDDYYNHVMRDPSRTIGLTRSRSHEEEEEEAAEDGFVFRPDPPTSWTLPNIVHPSEDEENFDSSSSTETQSEQQYLDSDAELYSLKEKVGDDIRTHTVLKMPSKPFGTNSVTQPSNTFNILMADVSGSMSRFWDNVERYWNEYVSPVLVGKTRIFTFDNRVRFRRLGTTLEKSDFSCGGTELTGALQTVVSQVYSCPMKYVNVFIITDGDHNGCRVSPQTVIDQMNNIPTKVCSVYLLGAGNSFPVQYSIDIRSRLHNGNSNLPSLYWAKAPFDIQEQMEDIKTKLTGGFSLTMKLNILGTQLPGLKPKSVFHNNEWIYVQGPPEEYRDITATCGGTTASLKLNPKEINTESLFELFRQWNSCIIQLKYRKEDIPEGLIELMERLFTGHTDKSMSVVGPLTLRQRLGEKDDKRDQMEFRTIINGIKSILTEEKFSNQIELAEKILSTAVTRKKFEIKALQLKGHTDEQYEADLEEFSKVYNEQKENILKLNIDPEYCCQATKQSTLCDLQDEDFPELLKKDKFDFLKSFTLSGIPVMAPTRDSVILNPWSFSVQKILKSPYSIMSQVAMEAMATEQDVDKRNKEVQASSNDEDTNFNAILPIFPPSAAKTMQPIVRTRIYAMLVTFATLKNPHIIDFNVHMASLGVTWVRLLFENPDLSSRPDYAKLQMESIEATAACYLDRPGFANYCKALLIKPNSALMTESEVYMDDKPIKCESIVKPMFLLNLMQRSGETIPKNKLIEIMKVMIMEYIGRCLSHYKSDMNTPYTDFFAGALDDQKRKKEVVDKYIEDSRSELSQGNSGLLESFYTLEKARKAAEVIAKGKLEDMKVKISAVIPAKVNLTKVEQLRNVSSAGDVSLGTLKIYAEVIGLSKDEIDELFSEESYFVYAAHALKYKSSKERLGTEIPDYITSKMSVSKEIQSENLDILSKHLYKDLVDALENTWLQEYLDVHTEVVEPMAPQQIVQQAQHRGIDVTLETFDQVYKRYRPQYGLLGNACQTKACPYYLQPNKAYNQHSSVERLKGKTTFVHCMHKIAYQCRDKELPKALSELALGKHNKDKKTIPEDDVELWSTDIKKLKNIYSEQEKAKE